MPKGTPFYGITLDALLHNRWNDRFVFSDEAWVVSAEFYLTGVSPSSLRPGTHNRHGGPRSDRPSESLQDVLTRGRIHQVQLDLSQNRRKTTSWETTGEESILCCFDKICCQWENDILSFILPHPPTMHLVRGRMFSSGKGKHMGWTRIPVVKVTHRPSLICFNLMWSNYSSGWEPAEPDVLIQLHQSDVVAHGQGMMVLLVQGDALHTEHLLLFIVHCAVKLPHGHAHASEKLPEQNQCVSVGTAGKRRRWRWRRAEPGDGGEAVSGRQDPALRQDGASTEVRASEPQGNLRGTEAQRSHVELKWVWPLRRTRIKDSSAFINLMTLRFNSVATQHVKSEVRRATIYVVYKDGSHDSSVNKKPKHLDCPLVAAYSVGHKSCHLHVSRWDMNQTKKSKYTSNKLVSLILSTTLTSRLQRLQMFWPHFCAILSKWSVFISIFSRLKDTQCTFLYFLCDTSVTHCHTVIRGDLRFSILLKDTSAWPALPPEPQLPYNVAVVF